MEAENSLGEGTTRRLLVRVVNGESVGLGSPLDGPTLAAVLGISMALEDEEECGLVRLVVLRELRLLSTVFDEVRCSRSNCVWRVAVRGQRGICMHTAQGEKRLTRCNTLKLT